MSTQITRITQTVIYEIALICVIRAIFVPMLPTGSTCQDSRREAQPRTNRGKVPRRLQETFPVQGKSHAWLQETFPVQGKSHAGLKVTFPKQGNYHAGCRRLSLHREIPPQAAGDFPCTGKVPLLLVMFRIYNC
jgi:hypothetical protein